MKYTSFSVLNLGKTLTSPLLLESMFASRFNRRCWPDLSQIWCVCLSKCWPDLSQIWVVSCDTLVFQSMSSLNIDQWHLVKEWCYFGNPLQSWPWCFIRYLGPDRPLIESRKGAIRETPLLCYATPHCKRGIQLVELPRTSWCWCAEDKIQKPPINKYNVTSVARESHRNGHKSV
jgi:hypothetical protein